MEFGSGADGQRALLPPQSSVLWNNDPHHQPAGSCRFIPNTTGVGAPAWINSPPEVAEGAKSPVAVCLLGFTEQRKFCSALLSAKQILLNTFSFVPFLLLKAGAAPNAEVQHNLIYSLLSLPAGAPSHLVCAFNCRIKLSANGP